MNTKSKKKSELVSDIIKALKDEEETFSNTNSNVKSLITQLDASNMNHEIKSNFKKKILGMFINNELILISKEILITLLDYVQQLIKFDIILNNSFMELDYEFYLINFIKNFNKLTNEYKKNNPKRFYLSFDVNNNYLLFIFLVIVEHYELIVSNKEFKFIQNNNYVEISLLSRKITTETSDQKIFKYLITSLDFKDKVSLVRDAKSSSVDYSVLFKKFYVNVSSLGETVSLRDQSSDSEITPKSPRDTKVKKIKRSRETKSRGSGRTVGCRSRETKSKETKSKETKSRETKSKETKSRRAIRPRMSGSKDLNLLKVKGFKKAVGGFAPGPPAPQGAVLPQGAVAKCRKRGVLKRRISVGQSFTEGSSKGLYSSYKKQSSRKQKKSNLQNLNLKHGVSENVNKTSLVGVPLQIPTTRRRSLSEQPEDSTSNPTLRRITKRNTELNKNLEDDENPFTQDKTINVNPEVKLKRKELKTFDEEDFDTDTEFFEDAQKDNLSEERKQDVEEPFTFNQDDYGYKFNVQDSLNLQRKKKSSSSDSNDSQRHTNLNDPDDPEDPEDPDDQSDKTTKLSNEIEKDIPIKNQFVPLSDNLISDNVVYSKDDSEIVEPKIEPSLAEIYDFKPPEKQTHFDFLETLKYNNIINVEENLDTLVTAKNCTIIIYFEKNDAPTMYLHFSKPENLSKATRYKIVTNPEKTSFIKNILHDSKSRGDHEYIKILLAGLFKFKPMPKSVYYTSNNDEDELDTTFLIQSQLHSFVPIKIKFDTKEFCIEKQSVDYKHINKLVEQFIDGLTELKIFESPFGIVLSINSNTLRLFYVDNILKEDDLKIFYRVFFYNICLYLFKIKDLQIFYSFWNYNSYHKEIINRISILFGFTMIYKKNKIADVVKKTIFTKPLNKRNPFGIQVRRSTKVKREFDNDDLSF